MLSGKTLLQLVCAKILTCLQMIHEVHAAICAGAAEGTIDAANILN